MNECLWIKLYTGLNCGCGAAQCRGVLKFDTYRNVDWQVKYYRYSSALVRKRIDELKTKWYSSSCYLKFHDDDSGVSQTGVEKKRSLALTSLLAIEKQDVVAKFADKDNVTPGAHYIRASGAGEKPNCFVSNDGLVLAYERIEPDTKIIVQF